MPARNISEYPQLLNAIHSAEKIVYLCGAGASMSIGSHRLSWTNWIAEGRKYLTIPEQNELNLKIGSWTAEELIDAATFLLGKLKSSGAYQTFMNQTIGALHPVNTEFKEALCKVWRAGDLIATTNYDTQIEETLNAKGVSYECPAEILSIIRSTAENKVIHLHGMYDERDGIDNIIADYIQSMHIRAAFIIASEAIYSPSAEYKRVPDKIINKAKQWSEQYPKKIEFQEAYFGLLFSRLKYAQAQDMRNEQRRVYREMKTVAERANYSEYNESNQLMESVDILHRVFGY